MCGSIACTVYARHDQQLGGGSPLWRLVGPTTSREQLRRREAAWGGSWRRTRDPRDTNRVQGEAVRASRHRTAKPEATKGPQRKRGGDARTVAGLIRGGLGGCPEMPVQGHTFDGWIEMPVRVAPDRRVGRDGDGREGAARRRAISSGHSTGGDRQRREGPNAWRRPRTPEPVVVAMTAANPVRGLAGEARG